ncbi:MAG: response regulator [Candidatus Peregrinibacteria bacterium]
MFHSLIVDDTPEKMENIRQAVEDASLNAPIECMESAEQALQHITAQGREVVAALFDYTFTRESINGIALIRVLREVNKLCYIALVTSHPQKSGEFRSRHAEATIAGADETYSTNIRPYDAFDWLYLSLKEKKEELLRKFGLQEGSLDHS